MGDISDKSAAELGRMIEAGKLDPVDLTRHYLDAIEESNVSGDIYARITKDRAIREAKEASDRASRGMRLSALDGVPISWKDLFDTAGVATESGCKLLEGRIPDGDCEVIKRAGKAGLVCLGKTHMTELAFSGIGINPVTATPPNRGFPGHVPGGSSSGAAASVAFDLAPLAMGSDTGGSVRIPAAWNDLVGLKTTHGVVPNTGVVPLCSGFDTVGPLAKTVEDAALAFEFLAAERVDLSVEVDLSSCRFLVCTTLALDNLDDAVAKGFEATIKVLEAAGASVVYGEIPEFEELIQLGPTLFPYEAWREWGSEIEKNPSVMFEPVKNRFYGGKEISPETYEEATAKMMKLRRQIEHRTGEYDAVLMPSIAILPPKVDELMADLVTFWEANLLALRNTRFINMTGGAALTLPNTASAGPNTAFAGTGIMLSGPPKSEIHLLRLGQAIEHALKN